MKLVPIVSEDEFTPNDMFADPDTSKLTPGVVIPTPTLLLIESTKNVPESIITFPDIVCSVPLSVALLTVVFPAMTTSPLKLPVLAEIINLPIVLPRSILLDVGANAVVFIEKPEVLKLAAFTTPV